MIATLRGTLARKSPTEIVVDVQGVGYLVHIPLSTFEAIGDVNGSISLFTFLHVREDALQLYGFMSEEELDTFRMLISVAGIGPKMAQGILSGIPVADLKNHIASGNSGALTTVPGIGRKLAERLIVELREKIGKLEPTAGLPADSSESQRHARSEALLALTSLGYSRTIAERALRAAIQQTNGADASVETLIKTALRFVSR